MKINDKGWIKIQKLTIENLQSSVPNLVAILSLASTSSQAQKTWSLSMTPLLDTSFEPEFSVDSSDDSPAELSASKMDKMHSKKITMILIVSYLPNNE